MNKIYHIYNYFTSVLIYLIDLFRAEANGSRGFNIDWWWKGST